MIMMFIFIIILDFINKVVYIHHNSSEIVNKIMSLSYLSDISEQLRYLRKQKGWSQQQLAQLSGLDRTTIGALERNDYSDIGIRKVQRVLELLGKTLTITDAGLPTLDQLQ
ncbi:hypothetical protein MNBD_GAMMA07-2157, partial [hydrothermal vent metagenome]